MLKVLLVWLLAAPALGVTLEVWRGHPVNAVTASADYTPSSTAAYIPAYQAHSASVQCVWASLTGTLDGQFIVQVSNDAGTTWTTKSGATITVSGASGNEAISLSNVVTEELYRVKWVHNNVSGGTVDCYASLKG